MRQNFFSWYLGQFSNIFITVMWIIINITMYLNWDYNSDNEWLNYLGFAFVNAIKIINLIGSISHWRRIPW
jgi:hypothetical protein